jgi:hypothetical protein
MAGAVGIGLLVFATVHWIGAISVPNLPRLGKSLILPMWLNLTLIPLSYAIALQLVLQGAFVDIAAAPNATRTSRWRAKLAVILGVGPRAYVLGDFGAPSPFELNAATTLADARRVARSLRSSSGRE